MGGLLDVTLAHLRALVAFDTRNPPRVIGTDGVFDYLRANLPGFEVRVTDHGAGAVSLLAQRGRPRLLFNVHLDTVPASSQWSVDPFALEVTAERATGLGACDIKGAAAALLAAANASDGDVALLFTTDEEGADPRCVASFLQSFPSPSGARSGTCELPEAVRAAPSARANARAGGCLARNEPGNRGREAPDEGTRTQRYHAGAEPSPPTPLPMGEGSYAAVIVAEPTRCEAVLAHRGIQSVLAHFTGRVGHAAAAQRPADSALHQAVRWGAAALDYAESQSSQRFGGLQGLRFNLGRFEGGIKANMIAPAADVRFGMRPLPAVDMDWLLGHMRALADPAHAVFEETFRGAPLPASVASAPAQLRAARELAQTLGMPVGEPVDFWTEAALFSAAGCTTLVYGPGDIVQAHAADEWVALADLDAAARTYWNILEQTP